MTNNFVSERPVIKGTIEENILKVVRDHAINHVEGWYRLYCWNGAIIEGNSSAKFEEVFYHGKIIKYATSESLGILEGDEQESIITRATELLGKEDSVKAA